MKRIKLKMGLTSAVITVVVIACVILLNSIVALIGDKVSLSIDLTRDKIYEFSEQTKSLMKELDSEINAYCLIPEGTESEYVDYVKAYLEKYKTLSDKFKVKYIDPYENPMFMQNYNDGENQANIGSVIIENGDKFKVITFDQLYTEDNVTNTIRIDMERKVTNAIMSVTGKMATSKIYFTEGHNEADAQYLQYLLSNEGYLCDTVSVSVNGIPEDADIIFSVLPVLDYTAEERDALDKFMDRGGKFILVADLQMPLMEKLDSYLDEWGIKLNRDFVIETDGSSALSAGTGMPVPVAKLQEHVITQKLVDSKIPLPMPSATSFSISIPKNGASVKTLLMTSEKAYGKTNLNSTVVEKEDGDTEGPLCLAAISEKYGEKPSALMVIGSPYAVLTSLVTEGSYLNGDFILNSINYLSGSEAAISIRAKQVSPEIMVMTQEQVDTAVIILQYVLPLVIIAIGLVIWIRRRFK
ncbi:MAG: hypothetical protein E7406_01035 [Ruminococcaceae bacterium]|nr:hypothetical protein [Oscillospiraceae bacterium]